MNATLGKGQENVRKACSESKHLHTILQLGTKSNKSLVTVKINKVPVEMEADSSVERSTVPLSVFHQMMIGVCKL